MTTRETHFLNSFDAVTKLSVDSAGRMTEWVFQRSIEGLMSDDDQWPVVGISVEALKAFVESNFANKIVSRGHKVSRRDRLRKLRSGEIPRSEMYRYWVESDEVVIVTKAENGKHGDTHWSEVKPLNLRTTNFQSFKPNKEGKKLLKEMYDAL